MGSMLELVDQAFVNRMGVARLTCSFCLSVTALTIVQVDPFVRYTSM